MNSKNNKTSVKEMLVDYKNVRNQESEMLSKMTEEQRAEYFINKSKEMAEEAKSLGIKTVSRAEILGGENNGQ